MNPNIHVNKADLAQDIVKDTGRKGVSHYTDSEIRFQTRGHHESHQAEKGTQSNLSCRNSLPGRKVMEPAARL